MRNKDLKSKLTSAKIREEALKQRQTEIERKERELDAKEVALAQNEDIQKLKLKLAEKEMKNVEAKRSMSVLNLGAEVQREPDMYLNQSVAGVGFDENQSYLVMNEKTFNSFSPEDQEAVMSVSGEAFAVLAGKAWDAADKVGLAAMEANGNKIETASPEFIAEIKAATKHLEESWTMKANMKGVEGEAALRFFRKQVKEYK